MRKMEAKKKPVGVDLFAGAGGMSLGFEQAGFDVAAAIEYDPIHCAVHEYNFPDCAAICRSVADIDAAYIRRNSRIGDGEVDIVFGGAPCQGFIILEFGRRGYNVLDNYRVLNAAKYGVPQNRHRLFL